ncbi:MAG: type II secretion system protein [Planctomycetes bacterium]|nr:type II secretion system protein [Planctomycetota bacterium]
MVRRDIAGSARAFTLVELLVVIAIIGVLAALTVTGVMRVIDAQNESNTRTAIQTAYSILQKHWAKVVADAKKETPSTAALQLAGNDPQRAQVVWVKLRLMEAFPASYDEVRTPPPYQHYPDFASGTPLIPDTQRRNIGTYQRKLGTASSANVQAQSAACLVMALSVNRGGVVLDEEKFGPFLKDSDRDGIPELVDGWGTPIAFFRFPTQYPNLLSASGSQWLNPAKTGRGATFSDPLDPDGLLQNTGSYDYAYFTGTLKAHAVASGSYIIPALASSGRDGKLGLNFQSYSAGSDMGLTGDGSADDNLYSFFLNVGSTGN